MSIIAMYLFEEDKNRNGCLFLMAMMAVQPEMILKLNCFAGPSDGKCILLTC